MKRSVYHLSFLFLIFATALQSYGQDVQVTGKVTDATIGETIPGVSILVKNTTIGTTTDIDGMYSIGVQIGSELVFSFIGYETQTIVVGQQKTIDVAMKPAITGLDEVVVVGYGVQRKSDVTGATSTLDDADFNAGIVTSPAEMMQGRISGVQVTTNSGEPGAGSTVRIRGSSSIRANQDPLYVVDGIPLNITSITPGAATAAGINASANKDPLDFLNPDDIESITVLKDASATAIYGSRGSNGVILITTKKGEIAEKGGREGELTYGYYAGISMLPKKLDVLSTEAFMDASDKFNLGLTDMGKKTDWQDEIFRTAITQSHNLAYSGGTDKSNYFVSFGYLNQDGIVNRTGIEKLTGRFNASQKLFNDKLTITTNLSVSRIKDDRVPIGETGGYEGDVLISALRGNPTFPVYNDDGSYFQQSSTYRNPVAMINLTNDNTYTDRFLGNITASYKIFKDLTYKLNLGIDHANATRKMSQDAELSYLVNDGQASIANIELDNQTLENYLTYNKQLNENNHLTALLGYSYQKFDEKGYNLIVDGFTVDGIDYIDNLQYGDFDNAFVGSFKQQNELQSFYARLNYAYKNKYLLTATGRADGSTKFGANNKYGYFPSVGVAWRLIEEDFIQDLGIFDNLKFRVGWGLTGNQEIPNKISLLAIGTAANANYFFDGENLSTGTTFIRTPNPDIKWETTMQTNVGFDFGFFNGKLSGSIDYFYKETKDVLLMLTSLAPAPTTYMWMNVPDMRIKNSGIGIDLTGVIIDKKDLSWTATFNFSTIKNEVVDLPVDLIETGVASGAGLSGTRVQIIKDGYPIGTFWGKQFLGYDADGISIYKKDAEGNDVKEDLGSALPTVTLGLYNAFTYKNFDFSFFINGVFGNKVYNNTANALFSMPSFSKGNNVTEDVITSGESVDNTPEFSSRFIEDGSFVRLSTATLGYRIPFKKSSWVRSLRVYVTGSNLFLITNYSGYDPEVNTNGEYDGVPSMGLDYTGYPRARTIQFGVNARF
ncbi:MAG: TonB-dependent receptor [Bacteroidetes bacterium]|nr:TonB-dependent receptor [Bacteroidota bacterium]